MKRGHWLVEISWWPRTLGYLGTAVGLGMTHAAPDFTAVHWAAVAFTGLLYPQLIYVWGRLTSNPVPTIRTHMVLDFVMAGLWGAAVDWELWIVFAPFLCASINAIMTAGPRWYVLDVVAFVTAGGLGSLVLGSTIETRTSQPALLAFGVAAVWLYTGLFMGLSYYRAVELRQVRHELAQANGRLERLASELRKYLPDAVYHLLFDADQPASRGADRRELAILFADIVGFTTVSDHADPEQVATELNLYLEAVSAVAEARGGTVDKFIGDAILVLFGAPDSAGEQQDTHRAIEAGLAMQAEAKRLVREHPEGVLLGSLRIRVGIHAGVCAVGNFGADNRLDYTAVGRTVNIASRLEGVAEPGQVLVSKVAFERAVWSGPAEPRGPFALKGIEQPVQGMVVSAP